jgi:hypothetical protein
MKGMTETILVWQCIGCGRIEGAAQCVGICQDRRVEMVSATDHAEVLARAEALEEIVRRIATITPRSGEWEANYRALQAAARSALSHD